MLFTDEKNEMPKSSQHTDLFKVFCPVPGGKSTYIEDQGEDPLCYKDAFEMCDIIRGKMMTSPLTAERLKVKLDILESICNHPGYLDEFGHPILKINNSQFFYNKDDYISFNDKNRNYPIMYIDKNFLDVDGDGKFRWLFPAKVMREFFTDLLATRIPIASMNFLKAVGPECEGIKDFNMFFFRSAVLVLLPMTRDFLDFRDHVIFGSRIGIMSKFYLMITMFIDYMFSIFDPKGCQYAGSVYYPLENRPNLVLAGFGAIGIKNHCYTAPCFFNDNITHINKLSCYFKDFSIQDQIRTDINLMIMLEDAYSEIMGPKHLIPSYGVVRVAENYTIVPECDICIDKSNTVLDRTLIKIDKILGTDDFQCTYGIVSSIGRNAEEARTNVAIYMLDCPHLVDIKVSHDIISVDTKGREMKKSRYNIESDRGRFVYKKRIRVFDFSQVKRVPHFTGIGTMPEDGANYSPRIHDESGKIFKIDNMYSVIDRNKFSYIDSFGQDDINNSDSLDDDFSDSSVDKYDAFDAEIGEKGDYMLGLFTESDCPVDVHHDYDSDIDSNFDNGFSLGDTVDIPQELSVLQINVDQVYWYAISVKRLFYKIGVDCGLTESQLNNLARGGYVKYSDMDRDVIEKVKLIPLFRLHVNKISVDTSYSCQVKYISHLFRTGVIKLFRTTVGGYVWRFSVDNAYGEDIFTI